MDREDRVGGLREDAVGPERPVQLVFSEPQKRVREGDGHEHARVEQRRVPRHGSLAVGSRPATPRCLQRVGVVGGGSLVQPEHAGLLGELVER